MRIEVNIVEHLGSVSTYEAIQTVKELDDYMGDWDFTIGMFEYFLGEYRKLVEEAIANGDEVPQYEGVTHPLTTTSEET